MRTLISILSLFLSLSLLTGCEALTNKEIARLPINQVSTNDNNLIIKEASLDLKKGEEIAIWSDMDMKYEGNVTLRFKIEILKNGEKMTMLEMDPTDKNLTIGEVKTNIMGKTNWSFTGKNSEIKIEEEGNYTFRGILLASDNPTLQVKKAEIVLKK